MSAISSYASPATSDTLLLEWPYREKWFDLEGLAGETDADKETARGTRSTGLLTSATRMLDLYTEWLGTPTDPTQPLAWPRTGVPQPRVPDVVYPDDTVPPEIEHATIHLAYSLLVSDPTQITVQDGIDILRVGEIEVDYRDTYTRPMIPPFVSKLVAPYAKPMRAKYNSGVIV